MEIKRYEITNSTVKPKRTDKDGKDLRSIVEKVGHPVQWREGIPPNDRCIILMPGRSRIVNHMDSGLMGLRQGGFVKIKEIADITTALAEHSYQKVQEREEKQQVAAATRARDKNKATAVEMGQDNHSQGGGTEHEGAVNPDGDPNFLVKAPRANKGAKTEKKEGENGGVSNPA